MLLPCYIMNTNICSNINNVHENLLLHLEKANRTYTVSNEFSSIETNSDRVRFVYSIIDGYNLFPALNDDLKCNHKSDEFRHKGNAFYKNKNVNEALELYTQSISYALPNSEQLALGFANRSAALFESGFYRECLQVSKYVIIID